MKIVCAWCDTVIAEPTRSNGHVSHGMCLECQHTFLEQRGVGLRELTNRALTPVLVVNEGGVVVHANRAASEALGNPAGLVKGSFTGVVIECDRATARSGCGTTVYCDACRLRDALKATHADGLPRYGVVSEHPLMGARNREIRQLHFSTIRASNAVVLLLERRSGASTGDALPRVESSGSGIASGVKPLADPSGALQLQESRPDHPRQTNRE